MDRMRGWIGRARAFYDEVPVRERWLVAGAMALTSALVLIYLAIRHPIPLVGDMPEYDRYGRFFIDGKWWWSTTPFGEAHPSSWKAPGYPLWMGFWYWVLGAGAVRVELVQAIFLAPLGPLLTWLIGRRLLTPKVGIIAAYIVAALPLVWEYYGLLYPEALAVPLTLLVIYLFLERDPTPGLAIGLGVLIGIGLLIRPTTFFVFAGVLAAWVIAAGWRRGVGLTALSVLIAALVVVPWTIRNYVVLDGFVPISIQDAFIYGVFNDESANDPENPYAWRAFLQDQPDFLDGPRIPDPEVRAEGQELALDYIEDHPFSVAEAFYWNGLSRYWDIRRPSHVTAEAPFVGGTKTLSAIGLIAHWVLLPLAIYGLWRLRGRPSLWVPLLAIALAASVVFTVGAATRYRAPIEPLIAILAVFAVTQLVSSRRTTSTSRAQT